jgi:tetratricopeptide (TPR) repeat protein
MGGGRRRIAAAMALGWTAAIAFAASERLPNPKKPWLALERRAITLYGDVGERKLAEIASELESFRGLLERLFPGATDSPVPTTVFAFDGSRSFDPYSPTPGAGGGVRVVGYMLPGRYDDFIALEAFPQGGGGYSTVYHEYVHSFVETNLPEAPGWLSEGLAQFYETFVRERDQAIVGRPPAQAVAVLRTLSMLSFDRLFATTHEGKRLEDGADYLVHAAQSWALVHYCLTELEGGAGRLTDLLRRLTEGEAAAPAVAAALGVDVERLQKLLLGHARSRTFRTYSIPLDGAGAEAAPRPAGRAEVLLRLAELQGARGRRESAEAHLVALLAEQPDSGDALALRAHLDEKKAGGAESRAAYAAAMQRTVTRAASLVRAGRRELKDLDELDDAERAAAIERALAWSERAVAMAPDFAEAAAVRGRALLRAKRPQEAVPILARAHAALPARVDVAHDYFIATLRIDDFAAARVLLEHRLRPRFSAEDVADWELRLLDHETTALYNDAVDRKDWTGARQHLVDALASTDDADLHARFEPWLAELDEHLRYESARTRYNRAIDLANGRSFVAARAELEALLEGDPPEELRTSALAMLEKLKPYLPRG